MTTIVYEKHVVETIIRLYCRRKEGNRQLCPQCAQLLDYAHQRLDNCTYGNDKPTCRQCPIHCYRPAMKQHMRHIMRWAGPRMILYHPTLALSHAMRELERWL